MAGSSHSLMSVGAEIFLCLPGFVFECTPPCPLPLRSKAVSEGKRAFPPGVGPVRGHGQTAPVNEKRDQFVKRVGSLSRRRRLRRLNLITPDSAFKLLLRGVRPTTTTTTAMIIMIK